jgi:ribonuclease BN (tRNA processing enzyme)
MVLTIGSLEARFGATDHGTPTLAVGLAHQGATLAYSADSGPGWSVEELGSGIGTFLCEATYTQESEGSLLHLSGREAGAMARAAGVGRLILTHRWPTVSADDVRREAELAFGRSVEQASTGAVFDW